MSLKSGTGLRTVNITAHDLYIEGTIAKFLSAPYLKNITIDFTNYSKNQWDATWYQNHNEFYSIGLCNKPVLKTLTIQGNLIAADLLGTSNYIGNVPFSTMLAKNNLKFLNGLKNFQVTGYVNGSSRQDYYIFEMLDSLPNLTFEHHSPYNGTKIVKKAANTTGQ